MGRKRSKKVLNEENRFNSQQPAPLSPEKPGGKLDQPSASERAFTGSRVEKKKRRTDMGAHILGRPISQMGDGEKMEFVEQINMQNLRLTEQIEML